MDIFSQFGNAKQLLISPASYFRDLQEEDVLSSVIFVLLMAVLSAVLNVFFSEGGFFAAFFAGLGSALWTIGLWLLLATPALYFLWSRYGSGRSFTASFLIGAAATVFMPIFLVLHTWLGALGLLLTLLWLAYLLSVASVEVHGLTHQESMPILAAIAGLLFLFDQVGQKPVQAELNEESAVQVALSEDNQRASETLEAIAETNADFESLQAEKALPDLTAVGQPEAGELDTSTEPSAASQLGAAVGGWVSEAKDGLSDVGSQLEQAGAELKASLGGESGESPQTGSQDESVTEGENQSLLTGLASKTGETVGAVTRELGDMAAELKQGFDAALIEDEATAEVEPSTAEAEKPKANATETVASDQSSESANSESANGDGGALNSAGKALGNVVQGIGDIAAEVGEGFQRAMTGDEAESPEPNGAQALTPSQLGESMAAFVLELDKAIDSGVSEADSGRERASAALEEFIESYRQALREDEG